MFLNKNTEIIIGPPGTGKTATLIKLATEIIASGVAPDQVGYISFTRQAVREASSRIIAATGHSSESFKGFRTLHAMTFWLLGKEHKDITNFLDIENITYLDKHTVGTIAKARTRMYAQLYNLHRVTGKSISEVWAGYASTQSGTEEDFMEWIQLYKAHKIALGKVDFTDLIQDFTQRDISFPFDYLFIDEAQDFSADQWGAAQLLARHSKKVFVAGDSDQAVFGWSGGKSTLFDEVEGERRVLSQSYRVPKLPHILATRCLRSFGREPLYEPTPLSGQVKHIFFEESQDLPLDNGETWFLLARNNFQVEAIARKLYAKNIFFRPVSSSRDSEDGHLKYISRIKWYEEWLETGTVSKKRKKLLEKEGTDVEGSVEKRQSWLYAFDIWPNSRIDFFRSTRPVWEKPKVFVGTFHASKGAESDNVVLYGCTTARISSAVMHDDPEEHRALYVAMTRTRKNLYLVQKQGKAGIEWSKFQKLPEDLTNGLL